MPRRVDRVRRPLTSAERRERSRRRRVVSGAWVDPFPTIMGTRPEKIVYAQLMYRGINFYFQSMLLVNLPLLKISKEYRPDFILPDQKIIIEVQGIYFHSKPDTIESDAYKQALYNLMGYKVLAWWDYEIEENVIDLFIKEPLLANLTGRGGRIKTKHDKSIDDLKGLRTTNRRRFRAPTPRVISNKIYRRRKALSSYATRTR